MSHLLLLLFSIEWTGGAGSRVGWGQAAAGQPEGATPIPLPEAPGLTLEQALTELRSTEHVRVVSALHALGRRGDLRAFRPITDLLKTPQTPEIKDAGLAALEKLRYTPGFLLKVLQTPQESSLARAYAAYTLGLMESEDAVPALIQALSAPEEDVRERAIEALGRIQDPRAWQPLIRMANKDPSPALRRKAQKTVESVSALGSSAGLDVEALNLALKDPDVHRRREAAQALSRRGNWWSIPPLIEALDDSDGDVRRYAARALGDRQDRRAVEPLAAYAVRSGGIQRHTALAALAVLRDPVAVPTLVALLKDPDPETRRYAARALGACGDPSGAPALVALLDEIVPENRFEAIRSLGLMGAPVAISRLARVIREDKESTQIEAARAIGRIGGPDALKALLPVLSHSNVMVVVTAIIGLKAVGLPEAIPHLEQLARKHPDSLVREEALETLVELRGAEQRRKSGVGTMPKEPEADD